MERILVVDDNEAMRGVIKDNLSAKYEVLETDAPENVLALALEHKPDAILLDLSMPGLSGFELCRVLSSLTFTQQIPIFIISGADERNKTFCQSLGARGYYTKPIDFKKLKTQLAELVVSKKTERRADVRVPLRLTLKLRGKDRNGNYFDARVVTENVSKVGFLCACSSSLGEATTVSVSLCGERELDLGYARLARVEKSDSSHDRYGFQFIGTSGAKIVE